MRRMYSRSELSKAIKENLENGSLNINARKITGDEIVENMTEYGNYGNPSEKVTLSYKSVCKNGNKITFVWAGEINTGDGISSYASIPFGGFSIPSAIGSKIFPVSGVLVDSKPINIFNTSANYNVFAQFAKDNDSSIRAGIYMASTSLPANITLYFRYETTFLLSENFVSTQSSKSSKLSK